MTDKHGLALLALALVPLFLFSGCTFYGQNDAVEHTRSQLVILEQQIQDSYVRSHATFQRLENAAEQNENLSPFVSRYRRVLTIHGNIVKELKGRQDQIREISDYRKLARLFKAALSGRELIENGYQKIARNLMQEAGSFEPSNPKAPAAVSILIPPYFRARQSAADNYTIVDGLRALNY